MQIGINDTSLLGWLEVISLNTMEKITLAPCGGISNNFTHITCLRILKSSLFLNQLEFRPGIFTGSASISELPKSLMKSLQIFHFYQKKTRIDRKTHQIIWYP